MGRNQKRSKGRNQSSRDWDEWQRYLQKEKQRLLHKSGKKVVELSFTESEKQPQYVEDDQYQPEPEVEELDVHQGRHYPVPSVPREEALQVSDDAIGKTVKPFTVNDYRQIKPLTSSELFENSDENIDDYSPQVRHREETSIPEPVVEVVEPPKKREIPKPIEKPKSERKKSGRKKGNSDTEKQSKFGTLQLFSGDISEHQALNKQRLTRKSKLEREELIEKLLDPVISLEEAATLIGVCKTTVRRYTNRGELDCLRTPGSQRRFKLSQVLEFVKNREDDERARRNKRKESD